MPAVTSSAAADALRTDLHTFGSLATYGRARVASRARTRNEERGHIYRFSYLSKDITKFILELHSLARLALGVQRTCVPGVITVVKKLNVVRKTNIFYYMHFAILYILSNKQ